MIQLAASAAPSTSQWSCRDYFCVIFGRAFVVKNLQNPRNLPQYHADIMGQEGALVGCHHVDAEFEASGFGVVVWKLALPKIAKA